MSDPKIRCYRCDKKRDLSDFTPNGSVIGRREKCVFCYEKDIAEQRAKGLPSGDVRHGTFVGREFYGCTCEVAK